MQIKNDHKEWQIQFCHTCCIMVNVPTEVANEIGTLTIIQDGTHIILLFQN